MKANLILYNTVLTPSDCFPSTDLLEQYLLTCETQGEYPIEYNGSRNIRLVGNFTDKLLYGGNYCKITFPIPAVGTNVFYCFVDDYLWLNDTAVQLNLTLDYLATFGVENLNCSASVVKQRTLRLSSKTIGLPNSSGVLEYPYLQRNIEYSNVIPVNSDNVKYTPLFELNTTVNEIQGFNGNFLRFLVITIDGNTPLGGMGNIYSGLNALVIPFITALGEYIYYDYYRIVNYPVPVKTSDMFYVAQGHTISMAVVNYGNVRRVYETEEENFGKVLNIDFYSNPVYVKNVNNTIYYTAVESYKYTKPLPKKNSLLFQQPYASYVVLQTGQQEQLIDINSIASYNDDTDWTVEVNVQSVYPNNTVIKISGIIDKTVEYVLPPVVDNFAYAQSAWAEYYASNSASVRDGLSTKHAYDIEMTDNNIKSSIIQGAISGVAGVVGGTANIVGGNVGGGISQIAGAVGGTLNTLIGSAYAYDNAMLGIEQETAMLQIAWNDIKNAPNRAYNSSYNNNERAWTTLFSGIYAKEPANYNAIKNYHNLFGYSINLPVPNKQTLVSLFGQPFDGLYSDANRGGRYFDYVIATTTIINSNIPNSVKRIIERIISQGVYIWKFASIASNTVGIKRDDNYGSDYVPITEV